MALTATATLMVRQDILKQLHLASANVQLFATSFDRPNLHYEVRFKPVDTNDPFDDILQLLQSIYANRTKRLAGTQVKERVNAVCGIM